MNWFRVYNEARNDAKLRTLTDAEFRIWFNLLCYSAEQPERGSIAGVTARDICDAGVTDVTPALLLSIEVANGDVSMLSTTVKKLTSLRIVAFDDAGLTLVNFRKRQYDKPSDIPEETRRRKAEQRERERASKAPDVTPPSKLSRDVTPSHATDTDTDTEQIQNRAEENVNGTVATDAAPKTPRGSRFSSDAELTQAWIDEAIEFSFTEEQAREVFAEFRDYWCSVAGSRGVKLDWLAVWRNHLRRQIERKSNLTRIGGRGNIEMYQGEPVYDSRGSCTPAFYKRQMAQEAEAERKERGFA